MGRIVVVLLITIMMCVVSSLIGEYSSNVPDGLRVTLDCPMRKTRGQIGNQWKFPRIVGCCERGLVLNARIVWLLYNRR